MASVEDSGPGAISEVLGSVAYAFAQAQPYLPLYTHLILSALFPIVTGAYASLSRPSSAAKPTKKSRRKHDNDDDHEEEFVQKMEGLSPSDAILFPLFAGCTLGGLYLLIKYMGASLLNQVLRWYFSAMGVFSVAKLVNDGLGLLESFCFPNLYVDDSVLWRVSNVKKKAVHSPTCSRPSPLPGVLGRVLLPQQALQALWISRGFLGWVYWVRLRLPWVGSMSLRLTLRMILSAIVAVAAVFSSQFLTNAWWLTNLQGFAFSYGALLLMSPTTFTTGSLVLAALFFYDIYFVFYTPLMVTVATKLDVPIKLLFPRPLEEGQDPSMRRLAMLGLGDVVIPGMMVGLALRYDLYMFYLKKQIRRASAASAGTKISETGDTNTKSEISETDDTNTKSDTDVQKEVYRSVKGHWGNKFWTSSWMGRSLLPKTESTTPAPGETNPIPTFPKPYFYASMVGYVLGMCTTLGVMQVFNHAQPALLYLVPGVLASLWLTAAVRGELKQMWEFSEFSDDEQEQKAEKEEEKDKKAKDESVEKKNDETPSSSSSWWSNGFFAGNTKQKAHIVEVNLPKNEEDSKNAEKGKDTGLFHFSVTPGPQVRRSSTPSPVDEKTSPSLSSSSDDAVLVTDADLVGAEGQAPRWRGSASVGETNEERAGKRRRI